MSKRGHSKVLYMITEPISDLESFEAPNEQRPRAVDALEDGTSSARRTVRPGRRTVEKGWIGSRGLGVPD